MPQKKDDTAKIIEKIASLMISHNLDLEDFTSFVSEHSQQIITRWTGIREHWERQANQQKARREVLKLSLSEVPHEEISERLGMPPSGITRIITLEKRKISKTYHQDRNCLHDLAKEYGLTTTDIISIYHNTENKRAKKIERRLERAREHARDWKNTKASELEPRTRA